MPSTKKSQIDDSLPVVELGDTGDDVPTHPSAGAAMSGVLNSRAFRFLWFGQICSQLANNTVLFILALRVYQATGSNTWVSGLFIVYGIPAVLFGLIAGTIVDKLDNRRVLFLCDIARAFLTIWLLFFSANVPVMYLITFLNAIIAQFYVPAEAPTIPRLVPRHLLVTANSLFSFTYFSSLAVGSIFAGPLLKLLGPQNVFLLMSVLFVVASWCARQLPAFTKGRSMRHFLSVSLLPYALRRIAANLEEGLTYIKASPVLMEAITLLTATQVIFALLGTLGPGFADKVLEIDLHDASLIITGPVVLGIILGALWVGNIGMKYKPDRLIRIGVLGAGFVLMVISLTVRLSRVPGLDWLFTHTIIVPIAFVLFFVLGLANSLLDVPANSILQEEARGEMRGRVYGLLTASVGGLGILPVVIGGVLADSLGVGKVIFFLGLLITSYGVYRIKYNKHMSFR